MTIEVGKIYVPANAEEIRDDFLTDIRLEAIKQGVSNPPVLPGSDWHVLGTALANLALIQYSNIRISEDDANLLTATGQPLDNIREAYGLPEVPASPATGAIVVSVVGTLPVTIPDGTEFVLPNGLRGKVDGTFINVFDGGEVNVVTIDTGDDTNLGAGDIVQFVSPPVNVQTEAEVSVNSPLSGGTDEESDERKRARILNRLQNVPAGGNWGDLVETSLNALASLQYAFVYPAIGGPASVKVVLTKNTNPDKLDFSRQLNASAVNIVRSAIYEKMPSPMEVVVQSVTDEGVDASVLLEVPNAATAGGNGQGWRNATPWPNLVPADGGFVPISNPGGGGFDVELIANTTVLPIPGQTYIAWWSSVDQKFYVRLVTGVVLAGPPVWRLNLDAPLVDSQNNLAQFGDYISPAAVNSEAYGKTWRTIANDLGPGENTTDPNRLPRSLRHPLEQVSFSSNLTIKQLQALTLAHQEISDANWSFRSLSSPTIPFNVSDTPNILVPRHFGIYRL